MYFVLYKEPSGKYYYCLFGEYLNSLIFGEHYQRKEAALKDIEAVKKNLAADKNIEFKTTDNGNYYFEVKNMQGNIMAHSGSYKSAEALRQRVDFLKQGISSANVIETVR